MKVTLMRGIASISGTVKQANGRRMMFMTRTNPSTGKSETRMYFRSDESYQRKDPPSEKEMQARHNFARRAKLVKQYMQVNPHLTKQQAWDMAKHEINTES